MAKLVKMIREVPSHVNGPTTADVHPDEVSGWMAGGWKVAPEEKAPAKKGGSKKIKTPEPELSDEDLV